MPNKFHFSYYYVSEQNYKNISDFKEICGDSEKGLVNQFMRGWIGRNREYYRALARRDAECRGMSMPEWAKVVLTSNMRSLPDYIQPIGEIPKNPLQDTPLSPDALKKRTLNYITLTTENIIFLKAAIFYDGSTPINFISRVVQEHMTRNWETLYAPQVKAEDLSNWS